MSLKERLSHCAQCEHREYNQTFGLVCSLTQAKPEFESSCSNFVMDIQEKLKISAKENYSHEEEEKSNKGAVWVTIGIVFIVIKIILNIASS